MSAWVSGLVDPGFIYLICEGDGSKKEGYIGQHVHGDPEKKRLEHARKAVRYRDQPKGRRALYAWSGGLEDPMEQLNIFVLKSGIHPDALDAEEEKQTRRYDEGGWKLHNTQMLRGGAKPGKTTVSAKLDTALVDQFNKTIKEDPEFSSQAEFLRAVIGEYVS